LDEAARRASAYAGSEASGFFAPGLRGATHIGKLCERSPIPVNILVLPGTPPPTAMASLGVARLSYGPGPYRLMIEASRRAGRAALSQAEPS